jgi:S-adenosylmethionine:tRNA ribosyltransferase-isomerase
VSEISIITSKSASDLDDFSYHLPTELIAQEPLAQRASSRLLRLDRQSGQRSHHQFSDIVDLLKRGDTLVLNDTKVIPARLIARRASGGTIKLQLLKSQPGSPSIWQAMVMPIRRLKPGEELEIASADGGTHTIKVVDVIAGLDGYKRLVVDLGKPEDIWKLLSSSGFAPLPPYIVRDYSAPKSGLAHSRLTDLERYQTVFARQPGAVAAPTAGLHFTSELLAQLQGMGVNIAYLTLHVGAGTFKPISTSVQDHTVEPEIFTISPETADLINETKRSGNRVIAVGTTSLRALESSCEGGVLLAQKDRATELYVKPGCQFQIVDGMITNFHLSQSSLLVLVAALAGRENIMRAYKEAVEMRYRFFSYGDAMLIV